jgi:hypothetical protein
MSEPGVQIETLDDPWHYAPWQIEFARRVAARLGRGLLVLCETPRG